jgi:hypothetical protein
MELQKLAYIIKKIAPSTEVVRVSDSEIIINGVNLMYKNGILESKTWKIRTDGQELLYTLCSEGILSVTRNALRSMQRLYKDLN